MQQGAVMEAKQANHADTIVLVHGLWVTSRSWENWVEHFRKAGYSVVAPAYPGLDIAIEDLRQDPTPIADLTIEGVAAHYEKIVRAVANPPILMGHSFGGTIVQMLLDRGLGAAGVVIDSVPVKGIRTVPLSEAKAAFPVLGHLSNRHKAVPLTLEQFRYAISNTVTEEETQAAYDRYYIPGPGRIVWDGVLANFSPHAATEVNFSKADRAPLLFIAGGADHLMPPSVNRSNYRHYTHHSDAIIAYAEFPGRSHFTIGQPGWQDVADYALSWAENPRAISEKLTADEPTHVQRTFPGQLGKNGEKLMAYIKVGEENSTDIELYYEDHGTGRPVVLIHGYPLSGRSWEKQEAALLDAGYRVITYDRRGFGRSSQPSGGYNYDTLSSDLNTLLETLQLDDVTLVSFSMGSGEVVRYLRAHGSARVRNAALLSPIGPFLRKTDDNPEGVPSEFFQGIQANTRADRPAAMKAFLDNFYNMDVLGGSLVSDSAWKDSFNVALEASPIAAVRCVDAWLEDFRDDIASIDVPVLVVQGDADRILPPPVTGDRLPALLRDVRHVHIEGGPHAIGWTHAEQVNKELVAFLR
jgi:non-heme chloroperoxidase